MTTFFNQTATISYQGGISSVRVTFRGSGDYLDHQETLRIAKSVATLHRVSAYLLEKPSFDQISAEEFSRFFLEWLTQLADQATFYAGELGSRNAMWRVALLVPPTEFSSVLKGCLDDPPTTSSGVSYKVCVTPEEAVRFLRNETSTMSIG